MGLTVALEFGLVGFGFLWRDLFLLEIRLGVVTVLVAPWLLSEKFKRMRNELMDARDALWGRK